MIRRLYQFLLVPIVAGMVLLVLYAAPPTRPWMEANLGPPLSAGFGSVWALIKSSPPYTFLIANPLWIAIISFVLGICPISFPIIHGAFNRHRGWFVRSARRESREYPVETRMKEPLSSATREPEPTPTSTTKKEEPKPEPTPEPTKTSEEEAK